MGINSINSMGAIGIFLVLVSCITIPMVIVELEQLIIANLLALVSIT